MCACVRSEHSMHLIHVCPKWAHSPVAYLFCKCCKYSFSHRFSLPLEQLVKPMVKNWKVFNLNEIIYKTQKCATNRQISIEHVCRMLLYFHNCSLSLPMCVCVNLFFTTLHVLSLSLLFFHSSISPILFVWLFNFSQYSQLLVYFKHYRI